MSEQSRLRKIKTELNKRLKRRIPPEVFDMVIAGFRETYGSIDAIHKEAEIADIIVDQMVSVAEQLQSVSKTGAVTSVSDHPMYRQGLQRRLSLCDCVEDMSGVDRIDRRAGQDRGPLDWIKIYRGWNEWCTQFYPGWEFESVDSMKRSYRRWRTEYDAYLAEKLLEMLAKPGNQFEVMLKYYRQISLDDAPSKQRQEMIKERVRLCYGLCRFIVWLRAKKQINPPASPQE